MPETSTIAWVAFLMASSLTMLLFLIASGRKTRLDDRIRELSDNSESGSQESVAQFAQAALPKMGAALMPSSEEVRTKLQTRLIHAGKYNRQAMTIFLGVKLLMMVSPGVLGVISDVVGLTPFSY